MKDTKYQVLDALPVYGSPAIALPSNFSGVSQGYVVKFTPSGAEEWIGNFRCGNTTYSAVHDFPDGKRVVVIAGGADYLVNPETRAIEGQTAENISFSKSLPRLEALIFGNNTQFWAENRHGRLWSTGRLSWDGITVTGISDHTLKGQCYSVLDESWHSFDLNLESGAVSGNVFETDRKAIIQIQSDGSGT